MSESELIFILIFILCSYCLIYPPTEFVSLGLTLNQLCSNLLGSEEIQFVQYHTKRSSLTLIVHSILPIAYVLLYYFQFGSIIEYDADNFLKFMFWNSFVIFSISVPIVAIGFVYYWFRDDWEKHPISRNLSNYSNNNSNWRQVAAAVNAECRRLNKMIIKTNAITSVIATENWIIKTSPYIVYCAHQSDTALIAVKSDTHPISQNTSDIIQFVNIIVKPTRAGVAQFSIRVNALDFKDLQDIIDRPITILSGVNFNRTVIERFVDAFKEQIDLNPRYKTDQISDSCFACMINEPNVKLHKQCLDVDENGDAIPDSMRCGICYCRPMWCVDCMAKWFASKQNQYEKEVWLQQKCTCPMCRVPFCILDVMLIEKE